MNRSRTSPTMIVWERQGRWAQRLRGRVSAALTIREVRSLDECSAELRVHPAALLAIEANASNADQAARWLTLVRIVYPAATPVVLASESLGDFAALLRETGAVDVLQRAELHRLLAIVDRFLQRHPPPRLSPLERVAALWP